MSAYPSKKTLLSLFIATTIASASAIIWATWSPEGRPPSLTAVAQADGAPARKMPKAARPAPLPLPKPVTASKTERAAAQKVISAQLQAFKTGDWKEATKYQSAGLKKNFPSPELFGQMIQKTYPAFVNPKKVTYGPAFNIDGHIQIQVDLTRYDGETTRAIYALAKEKDGYRVESVIGGETIPDQNATVA